MNTRMFFVAVLAFLTVISATHSAERDQRFYLKIDRGPLSSVFHQFSVQTGWAVITEISVAEKSLTHEIGPFAGYATADEALRALLQDTDLWFGWIDEYTISIFALSGQRTRWSSGVSTAREASNAIRGLAGIHYETGVCSELVVGPFRSDEPITAEEAWIELIRPYCPVIYRRTGDILPGSIDRLTVAGQKEHDFSIDPMPRILALRRISEQAGGLVITYISEDDAEAHALVGTIRGSMSVNEALRLAIRDTQLYIRWAADDIVSVEPTYSVVAYADMSKCPCNFGLPELWPLKSEHVTVTGTRFPSIEEYIPGRVAIFERREIEATGVSSIPDFLRHVTQIPYMRSRGYRLSGAQFAELRGIDPRYTLVLINGTRADVSASDLMVSAFDLHNVPISAVERIEISAGSPSLVHGMDAIGGIINIILHDDVTAPYAEARYGSASGGARERIGTVAAGTSTDRATTAFFIDYFESSELLGESRSRWLDMDRTDIGGTDRRSRYSAPPNVYTLDGQNLPGLDAPNAAVSVLPSGEIAFRPGEINLTSSLAMQAIVPEMRRTSITGLAELDLGSAKLSGNVIFVHRHAHFQMGAAIVPGYVMAASHPENPFGVPVAVDASLIGLPPRATDSRSELLRAVVKLNGPIGDSNWRYHSFLRVSRERASAAQVNFVDTAAVLNELAAPSDSTVNMLGARPGEGVGAKLIAPRQSNSTEARGSQVAARAEGRLPLLRVDTTLGVEYRTEAARFNALGGPVQRHEASAFGTAELPLGERFSITYGMRVDDFSDLDRIRREQWGASLRPKSGVELRAAYNEAFHAPSLYDLYLPRLSSPVPVFDLQRREVSPINLITGGNPNLEPTTGASTALGLTLEGGERFEASVDFWRIRMRNHIDIVSPFTLLAHEGAAIDGRIVRDVPTALDQQHGRPGRLLALDISRANIGRVDARGVDLSLRRLFETSFGTFEPRIDLTYTDSFHFSDLPIRDAPMRDRAGIASVLGTIPSWRGTGSLAYRGHDWKFSVFARYRSSYNDYDSTAGKVTDRDIPSGVLWDMSVARKIGAHVECTIGISDVLNRAPPFAQVNDPLGFDISQGDLTGRIAFIRLSGSM